MASLVSGGGVAVRYDEASVVAGAGAVVLAPASRLAPSSMDTSEGPGPRVKAETPDRLAGTSVGSGTGTGTGTGTVSSAGLFAGIASSNKRPRPDDWLAPHSPMSPEVPLPTQHPLYATPQQQQQQQHLHPHQGNQQQPPLAHSTPLTQNQSQTTTQQPPIPQASNNNGYASPLSSGSYDPYSPNGKIGEFRNPLIDVIVIRGVEMRGEDRECDGDGRRRSHHFSSA